MSKPVFTTKSELRLDVLERLIDVMSKDITTLQMRISELENGSGNFDTGTQCYYIYDNGRGYPLAFRERIHAEGVASGAHVMKVKVVDE